MEKFFSIGEVAKIFNIPIKTLRYYDEIGLLKPFSVDSNTKYRYYSLDQFVLIDIIRNSKRMGLSLKEIKEILKKDMKPQDISNLLDEQINSLELKIREMKKLKSSMMEISKLVNETLEISQNEIFISEEKDVYTKVYSFISKNIQDQEVNLRRVISMSDLSKEVYSVFGCTTDANIYLNKGEFYHPDIRYYLSSKEKYSEIIPKGRYLALVFDDNSFNKEKYYKKIRGYIKQNQIEVEGNFIEEWIIPRLENSKESTLIKLRIKIKD